mgnify:CR=1 FL=1
MEMKERIVRAMQELPADATIEDALDRLMFLYKIERGLEQVARGQTVSQEEAKRRMMEWLR